MLGLMLGSSKVGGEDAGPVFRGKFTISTAKLPSSQPSFAELPPTRLGDAKLPQSEPEVPSYFKPLDHGTASDHLELRNTLLHSLQPTSSLRPSCEPTSSLSFILESPTSLCLRQESSSSFPPCLELPSFLRLNPVSFCRSLKPPSRFLSVAV